MDLIKDLKIFLKSEKRTDLTSFIDIIENEEDYTTYEHYKQFIQKFKSIFGEYELISNGNIPNPYHYENPIFKVIYFKQLKQYVIFLGYDCSYNGKYYDEIKLTTPTQITTTLWQ